MVYVPGYGEAAISMSSDLESADGQLVHTIRHVGNVTRAHKPPETRRCGGHRGPFGTSWPLESIEGMDVVVACGGIGLPFPCAGHSTISSATSEKFGKVTLLLRGAHSKDLMYPGDMRMAKSQH